MFIILNLKIIYICCLNLNKRIIIIVLNKLNTFERQSLFLFKSNSVISIIYFINFVCTIAIGTKTYIAVARRSTSIACLRSLLQILVVGMMILSGAFLTQNFINSSFSSYLFFSNLLILLYIL